MAGACNACGGYGTVRRSISSSPESCEACGGSGHASAKAEVRSNVEGARGKKIGELYYAKLQKLVGQVWTRETGRPHPRGMSRFDLMLSAEYTRRNCHSRSANDPIVYEGYLVLELLPAMIALLESEPEVQARLEEELRKLEDTNADR